MAVNFNIQFRINATTRVIRLTDTSTGFTYGKGCFYIAFPDGSVRNLPDFTNPDIVTAGNSIDIPCVTDINNNVITGAYTITYAVIDNTSAVQTPLSRQFDFNWIEPSNGITNLSDVVIPEVVFRDVTSYSPIGSFSGTLSRTLSSSFPTTSEASGQTPVSSTSSNTINVVSAVNYYEGVYTPTSAVSITYTHSSNSWLTIAYSRTFSKTFNIKKCPNQLELVAKINTYRGIIDAYKETNDTQFNILSEQYDLVIALYSHLITRYETATQDGSEPILRELLSILEPYTGAYSYQLTKMLPFELAASTTNSFTISDGTNTDAVALGSTLTFASGSAALVPIVTNNNVTYSPTFGTLINTFAQGNDARFHNPVTIGTANGLSMSTQVLSLAAATTGSAGAMSASDKTKLDGIALGATANVGTVTSVALTVPAAFSITGSPITTAGTLAITAGGTSSQYITGAGALATLNTANVPENTNLYFTTSRARTSISLTTTGTTGAATYDNTTGVLNIPSYIGGVTSFNTRTGAIVLSSADVTTALTYTPVPTNRNLTINGVSFDLSADRSWTIASGVTSFNTRTGAITPTAGDYTTALVTEVTNLYYTDARARAAISLTTTGTSGSATYDNATGVLNIPAYQGGVTSFNTRTGAITLTSGDVTTALTYTPYNATNPAGYITGITSGNVTTALGYTPENAANKGIANGYASLDGGGLVPSTQLPSYVDDVLEYTNLAGFPATGETGKIYVALDNNKIYRWSGTTYIEVSPTVGTIWGGITGTLSNQTDLQNVLNTKQANLSGTGFVKSTAGTISYDTATYYPYPTGDTTQYVGGDGSLISFPVAGQSGTIVRLVRNQTGATLTKGTVVYISGATGNNPIVSKALATGDSTSAQTFGLCQANIANNAEGYVVIAGDLVGLDTSAFTEGQQVYLSGTVAGTFTATKQYAPVHLVYIGVITRSHPTLGQIEVKIQNGYELDELHNVSAQSPANNDIIAYNTSNSLWEKKSIATTLGFTPYNATNPNNYIALTALSFVAGSGAYNNTTGVITIPTNNTHLTNGSNYITLASLSFVAGSGGYNSTTGVITIPTNNSQLTNGSNYITLTGLSSTATGLTYTNTTGVFSLTSGYVIPTTASATNWDTAYTNRITSLTTTGSSGSATLSSNTLNIPTYTLSGLGGQPLSTNLTSLSGLTYASSSFVKMTASGTFTLDTNAYYLSSNPDSYIALTALSSTATGLTYTNTTGVFSLTSGYVIPTTTSATNWDTAYTNRITSLTTTGSSGSATLVSNVLNIPTYTLTGLGGVPSTRNITINGTTYDLSADRTWTISTNPSARNEQNFIATAAQTTFTITGGYVVGLVDVFVNGVRYLPSDYTATNGTTVVLGIGLLAGDAVTILNYTSSIAALPTSRNVQDFTATAGQTTFTVTNGYIVGLIDVFVNGSKLTSSEFTATNGTTFVLTVASTVGDQVQSINYTASVNGISGAGTANYVPKFTASGTIGNSVIQELNGDIGIDVTPSAWVSTRTAISIKNGAQLTGYANGFELMANAYNDGVWKYIASSFASGYQSTNGAHYWYTSATGTAGNTITFTQAMTLDASGNLGINNTSPSSPLDVTASNSTAIHLRLRGRASDSVGQMEFWNNAQSTRYSYMATDSTNMSILTTQAIPLIFGTNTTERMRIDSVGNLGLGVVPFTNTLGKSFDLSGGGGMFSVSSDFYISTNAYFNTEWRYKSTGGAAVIKLGSDGTISFNNAASGTINTTITGLSAKMQIDSNGNVYIGTTDPNATNFGMALLANGEIDISRSSGTNFVMNRSTTNGQIIDFRYNNTQVGSISTNSNSLPSDFNFKKDINDISIGLNLITKLRPVHYRHKMDEDYEALSNGIIAQELEQSLLECGIEKNSLLMLQHKPNEKQNESQYWVDYTKMIPILIKGIQELSAKVTLLENK